MELDPTLRAYTAFFDEILNPKRVVDIDRVELIKQLRAIAIDLQLSDDLRGDIIMKAASILAGK